MRDRTGKDECGCVHLLDDRGADEVVASLEPIALVDRTEHAALFLGDPYLSVLADRVRRVVANEWLCFERCLPDQTNRLNAERHELDRLALRDEAVQALVCVRKTLREQIRCGGDDRPFRQRYRKLVILAGVAHVDGAHETPRLGVDMFLSKPRLRLPVEGSECGLDMMQRLAGERRE